MPINAKNLREAEDLLLRLVVADRYSPVIQVVGLRAQSFSCVAYSFTYSSTHI